MSEKLVKKMTKDEDFSSEKIISTYYNKLSPVNEVEVEEKREEEGEKSESISDIIRYFMNKKMEDTEADSGKGELVRKIPNKKENQIKNLSVERGSLDVGKYMFRGFPKSPMTKHRNVNVHLKGKQLIKKSTSSPNFLGRGRDFGRKRRFVNVESKVKKLINKKKVKENEDIMFEKKRDNFEKEKSKMPIFGRINEEIEEVFSFIPKRTVNNFEEVIELPTMEIKLNIDRHARDYVFLKSKKVAMNKKMSKKVYQNLRSESFNPALWLRERKVENEYLNFLFM